LIPPYCPPKLIHRHCPLLTYPLTRQFISFSYNPNNPKNPKDQNDSEDKANDQENESTDGRSKNSTADTDADKAAVKGHGKNGVDKFENAERVSILLNFVDCLRLLRPIV
jgi:hypothetical protein